VTAAEKIAAALGGGQREGRGWRCRCPLHAGHSPVICDGRSGRLLIRGPDCVPFDTVNPATRPIPVQFPGASLG
jgi:hypothetical protein